MTQQNIILGIAGGIAAYKTPELVRQLTERGADVQVVMTRSARQFVTSTSLQAVSGRPVRDNLWDEDAEAAMGHIELARWADLVLIAPGTAEILSRLAAGGAPDLLSTLCLATEAPIVIAPAMNRIMWISPAVQANRDTLEARGVRFLGPDSGDQACGETGAGRMMEPDAIAAVVTRAAGDRPLTGLTVMITAGPTREALDPVRYISNRSSGKMGYALARAASDAGASVVIVSGPVDQPTPPLVERVDVESAEEMFAATHERIGNVDIFIAAAAVADYRAVAVKDQKIKKQPSELSVDLTRNPDIVASIAGLDNGPFTVGFAAETENVAAYARAKLENKRLDMIVANQVGRNLGFDSDDNTVDVYWSGGERSFPTMTKERLAADLIALIAERFAQRQSQDGKHLSAVASGD